MIEVSHLTKRYGQVLAVDDLSFRAEPGRVTVKIFNVAGELVRTPFEAEVAAGLWFQAQWRGENDGGEKVAAGVYVVSVRGGGIQSLRKVILLK